MMNNEKKSDKNWINLLHDSIDILSSLNYHMEKYVKSFYTIGNESMADEIHMWKTEIYEASRKISEASGMMTSEMTNQVNQSLMNTINGVFAGMYTADPENNEFAKEFVLTSNPKIRDALREQGKDPNEIKLEILS